MSPWILLLLTIVSLCITLDALGLIEYFKEHPKTLFTWIWGNRGNSLHDQSSNNLKQYIVDRANFEIMTICIVATLFLADATVKAFLR